MRNLLYKIDISSLSWCFLCVSVSSVFLFLVFLVPSASKILRDLRVKFFTVTVTVFSKKHHTGSNLLQFVIPDILLPLFIRTSTIILFFSFFWGLQIFVLPSLSSFFFSFLIFAISSQVLCNFGDMYVHVKRQ